MCTQCTLFEIVSKCFVKIKYNTVYVMEQIDIYYETILLCEFVWKQMQIVFIVFTRALLARIFTYTYTYMCMCFETIVLEILYLKRLLKG